MSFKSGQTLLAPFEHILKVFRTYFIVILEKYY